MSEYPVESPSKIIINANTTMKNKTDEDLRRFSAAVRTSLDGIITGDLNGNITDVNDAVLKLYGTTDKNDLKGKNILDFVVESDRVRALQESLESVRTGQGRTTEYKALTKNGAEVPVEITTGFIRDEQGEPIGFVDIVHNVSERKKAEFKLHELEEKYRELADQLPVIVYEIDLNGRFTFVNEKAFEMTGYSREDFEKGININQMVINEDLDKLKTRIQKALCKEKIDYAEYTILRKDSSTFPAMACANAIFREGKVAGLRGIVTDITEHKKAEQELIESEKKYRDIFENARDAIYIHDLKGKIISINKVVQEYGYTQEQIIGKNMLKFIPKRYWPKLISQLSQVALGNRVEGVIEVNTPIGKIAGEYRSSPIIHGDRVVGVRSVMRDITAKKKTEEALLRSQQEFMGLFMGNPEAAAYLGSDYHVVNLNPKFEELFGFSPSEIKGKHINDVIVPKNKINEAKSLDKKACCGYVYHNTQRQRKDGSLVHVAVSAAPIKVGHKTIGFVAMYKDISDLKAAEKKLKETNEKLQVVGGLTRHDVRNKLSVISTNAYLLKKQCAGNNLMLEKLHAMERAVGQMTEIFEFAKTYESLGLEELAYLDVGKTIDETVALFRDLNNVKIVNKCGGVTVLADSLLRQMFYNLIDNSLKHGQTTSKIEIYYEDTRQDELRLCYEDDGVGIPEEVKPKLFAEGFTTGKGTGYGLYLIKKMTEVYGWTIQETGEPGKGARFVMEMPKLNKEGNEIYRFDARI